MSKLRVMHYMNQFFAGMGGEEKADVPLGVLEGAVRAGKRLQDLVGESAEIVVTGYCGDDYFAGHREAVLDSLLSVARRYDVKLLIAGPAFASGRYGFACIEVCHFLHGALGVPCVTGIHPENPGVDTYRKYKDRGVFTFPTTEVVSGMEGVLSRMAKFIGKLTAGSPIGPPAHEGYLARGFRVDEFVSRTGAERAVAMLLDKLTGGSFTTEIPVESLEVVPPPPRLADLRGACLAIATTSGVHAPGNPDGFRGYQNTKWAKYRIENLNSMLDANWEVIHGGYNTEFMKKNPNYGVPLDVCRDLEREGVFRRLYPYFYITPGARGLISVMHTIGREELHNMKADGVDAVLLVAT